MDQAQRLREIVAGLESGDQPVPGAGFFDRQRTRLPRIITFFACGDVEDFPGLAANLAVGLAALAPPVVLLAAGDVLPYCRLVGAAPRLTLNELGARTEVSEALAEGPAGVNLMLLDRNFLQGLGTLDVNQLEPLIKPLARLKPAVPLVLVALPGGLTLAALNFLLASQELGLCVAAGEEAAKQCYLVIKIVSRQNPGCPIALLSSGAGANSRSIIGTAARFLQRPVADLGTLTPDAWRGRGFYAAAHPGAAPGKTIDLIAEKLYTNPRPTRILHA